MIWHSSVVILRMDAFLRWPLYICWFKFCDRCFATMSSAWLKKSCIVIVPLGGYVRPELLSQFVQLEMLNSYWVKSLIPLFLHNVIYNDFLIPIVMSFFIFVHSTRNILKMKLWRMMMFWAIRYLQIRETVFNSFVVINLGLLLWYWCILTLCPSPFIYLWLHFFSMFFSFWVSQMRNWKLEIGPWFRRLSTWGLGFFRVSVFCLNEQ